MNKKSLNFLSLLPSKVEELVNENVWGQNLNYILSFWDLILFLWPHPCISLTWVLHNLNPHFSSAVCHKGKVQLALHWILQHVIYSPHDVVICLTCTQVQQHSWYCLSQWPMIPMQLFSPLLFMSLEITLRYLTLIYWRPNSTLSLNQPPLNSVVV